jgi:hypothetical protein
MRHSAFSYTCNACSRCCHDKIIHLNPPCYFGAGVTQPTLNSDRYRSWPNSSIDLHSLWTCRGKPLSFPRPSGCR